MTPTLVDKRTAAPVVRIPYLLGMDCLSIVAAYVLALWFRYESVPSVLSLLTSTWGVLALSIGIHLVLSHHFGLYARLWRHASVREAIHIGGVAILAGAVVFAVNFGVLPLLHLPHVPSRTALLGGFTLNLMFLGGSRLLLRIGLNWLAAHNQSLFGKLSPHHRRVLIMGAGDMGATVVRLMGASPQLGFEPVGLVDDDPKKRSVSVLGVPVMGSRHDIERIVAEHRISEVVIAMPTAAPEVIDDVCRICAAVPVATRVIPSLYDLLTGTFTVDQLRQWRSLNRYAPEQARMPHQPTLPDMAVSRPGFSNILVTGGAGFIGSNFVRYMLAKYPAYRIVVYDKLTYAGNPDNLRGLADEYGNRFAFVKGDICDSEKVCAAIQGYSIDAIVNFAAETHVDRSLMQPDGFLRTNVFGTYTLLEAAKQFSIVRYHQVSTDEVYGQVMRGSFSEQDPLETRSPYSASKAAGDLLVHAYHVSFGVPATITRASNNIGPYQYPEKVVPLFVSNAIDDEPLPVYGDGGYVRDYQHVADHCSGIDVVLHRGVPGEVYNLGAGHEVAAIDLAKMILDHLRKPHSLICLVADRDGQDRRYSLDSSKALALGWQPEHSFEMALAATIDWYVANEGWWRKIKSGEYRQYYEKQYRERLEQGVRGALSTPLMPMGSDSQGHVDGNGRGPLKAPAAT